MWKLYYTHANNVPLIPGADTLAQRKPDYEPINWSFNPPKPIVFVYRDRTVEVCCGLAEGVIGFLGSKLA